MLKLDSIFFFIYILVILATTGAFPSRPGRCISGVAVGSTHGSISNGSLTTGKFEMLINDIPLHENPNLELIAGVPYTWEIRGTQGNKFRGFLSLFTHDDGVDLSDALSIDSSSFDIARIYDSSTLPSCPSRTVAAGHNSRSLKGSVKGEVIFDETGKVNVETTAVVLNTLLSSDWYYSQYSVNVVSSDAVVIPPPTSSPSDQPTKSPSKQPTKTPSSSPTLTSTDQPSKSEELSMLPTEISNITDTNITSTVPSTLTTVVPSYNPSTIPTKTPTVMPTKTPTVEPTKVPTSEPTRNKTNPAPVRPAFSIFYGF